MKQAYRQVRWETDLVLGLTHLKIEDDERMLRKLKRIPLIMGGHEHQHMFVTSKRGAVAKADANAKTMYRHLLFRSGKKGKLKIVSELLPVDTTVVPDPQIATVVKNWEDKSYASFRQVGLEPEAVVYRAPEPLDGTEASVRNKQTNLGILIAKSMLAASPKADAAVFNSGSIRIDDVIQGVMTQLDIIRTLPFGGKLCEVEMTGSLLNKMLLKAHQLKGSGGYLQMSSNLAVHNNNTLLNGLPIAHTKT
jgi:2',3'-cyclic-nucleotide 2'-phosphodiesterase (5'-nucleotidase family)